mmetsp:Transcript_13015/g.39668  ORF Transcript_13015/g.39668 Transcript_13015/m.39668 type:complete len:211 (-) Transcript_13015:185-817(-)|eukprot:scaffold17836_cov31-Tisochrysis_lutea.AAC.1
MRLRELVRQASSSVSCSVDVLLAGQEEEDILPWLRGSLRVHAHRNLKRRLEPCSVGGDRLGHMVDGHRECARRDPHHRCIIEESAEPTRIKRGRRDDNAPGASFRWVGAAYPAQNLFDNRDEYIRVERPLVRLVEYDRAVLREVRLHDRLAKQYPVRHKLDARVWRAHALEANRVANLAAQFFAPLLCHPPRRRHRRHTARLRDSHWTVA